MISYDRSIAFKQRLRSASSRVSNKWRPSFGEVVSIINLIVLVVGGLTGYLLIERTKLAAEASKLAFDKARTQSDTIRTVADLSKILASVRPNVLLSVVANVYRDSNHNVEIKVENKGAHLIYFEDMRVEYSKLKPGKSDEFEKIVTSGVRSGRARDANLHEGVAPGGFKTFRMGSIYFADRTLKGIEADVFLDVYTDPVVVSATTVALSDVFPAAQLQAMSKQTFVRPALRPHIGVEPNHSITWKDDSP